MPKITYIQYDGDVQTVDVSAGQTVMEGAVKNGLRGIDADCGGQCACATCHVYVDPNWLEKTGTLQGLDGNEAEMIEAVIDPQPNSRLSCQVKVTDALDGLVVRLPKSQH